MYILAWEAGLGEDSCAEAVKVEYLVDCTSPLDNC
jgi:hypothetical protein